MEIWTHSWTGVAVTRLPTLDVEGKMSWLYHSALNHLLCEVNLVIKTLTAAHIHLFASKEASSLPYHCLIFYQPSYNQNVCLVVNVLSMQPLQDAYRFQSIPVLFPVIPFLQNTMPLRKWRNTSDHVQHKIILSSFYHFNLTYYVLHVQNIPHVVY